jgi:leucyl-tRNA synthetase
MNYIWWKLLIRTRFLLTVKMRLKIELPTNLSAKEVEEAVLSNTEAQKWLEGNLPKKVIVVPGKIVNIVL